MERRNRRLQLVGARASKRQSPLERAPALLDLVGVPEAAVLLVEQNELSRR